MKSLYIIPILCSSLGWCLGARGATITWQTTTPYRGKLDSPWYQLIISGNVQVENFEGQINSSMTIPSNARVITEPSVDEDDGVIDGRSPFAKCLTYSTSSGNNTMSIIFSRNDQGQYPTLAGLTFLGFSNIGPDFGRQLSAYDSLGNLIDLSINGNIPFHPNVGGVPPRIGDRFYGFYHDGGISRIETLSPGHFVDHVQWGWGVPEPGAACLTFAGAALILARRRR